MRFKKLSEFNFSDFAPSYDASKVFYARIDPDIYSSDELLKSLYYILWFPGYFGFNWNALHDCLGDFGWIACRKVVLVHESLPKLPEMELKIYLEVLRDSVLNWSNKEEHEFEVFFRSVDRSEVARILGDWNLRDGGT